MPKNTITFPTHVGRLSIAVRAAGPLTSWDSPAVFFSVNDTPILSVVMRDGEPAIDVLGTDPDIFEELPRGLQDGARWWAAMLPLIDRAWTGFVDANAADLRDAA